MSHLPNPSSQNPATIRQRLWMLCAVAVVLLVYASLVPLQFRSIPWDEALTRFRQTPWLNLNVYQRADWIANALVVMPIGFFAAGALFFDARIRMGSMLLMLGVLVGVGFLVIAIEFLQIWFPPRTVSQNDIFAGWMGAIAGPIAWPILGGPLLATGSRIGRARVTPNNASIISQWILVGYVVVLALYSMLPFDLMLTRSEWQLKWDAGKLVILPGAELLRLDSWRASIGTGLGLTMSAVRIIPVGFLLFFCRNNSLTRWGLLAIPLLIEVFQAPVFTRFSSMTEVVLGWGGGLLGLVAAGQLGILFRLNQHQWLRALIALVLAAGIAAGFLLRFDQFANRAEVQSRLGEMFSPPLVRYYWGTEFGAGSNLLGKLLAFGLLGAAAANAISGCEGATTRRVCSVTGIFAIILLGIAIESAQLFLKPLVPDASDVLIYLAGAWLGYKMWGTGQLLLAPCLSGLGASCRHIAE
ncbi:VanZ family protein [Stieleria varia]|uniref:VanZ like family protein n=1 Tax=Stieleria varia TaxID=2528005 RepID=A0A5C6AQD6_9BACT|nr:VanZ family protein [Stieleria varia]TWU01286.1 VanZ like family protein [Stieleria varia]